MTVVEYRTDTSFHDGQVQTGGLGRATYTIETSSLTDLNRDFPQVEGKDFVGWVNYYATGGRFLEIGGGREQVVARKIISEYPGISSYVALEPRPLSPEAENELGEVPNYRPVQGRIDEAREDIGGGIFDIAFAHRVFEHTELPVANIQQACNLLSPEGILFCDNVPMTRTTSRRLVELLEQTAAKVSAREVYPQSSWLKVGIITVSFAIRRGEGFTLPDVKKGEYLNNYYGERLPFRHCYF